MDCRKFHENLEDYLEGGLDFVGRFGMERHEQQCLGCGKVVADAQKLSRMARELKRVGAPADFETAVLQRIQKEGIPRPSWRFRRVPVFFLDWPSRRSVAVGALAIALLVFSAVIATRWVKLDGGRSSVTPLNDMAVTPILQPEAGEGPAPVAFDSSKLVQSPESAEALAPPKNPVFKTKAAVSTEDGLAEMNSEPSVSDYVEYLVPGPGNRQYVMRLPKTIRMRYGQSSEEYFIRNVSH